MEYAGSVAKFIDATDLLSHRVLMCPFFTCSWQELHQWKKKNIMIFHQAAALKAALKSFTKATDYEKSHAHETEIYAKKLITAVDLY